MSISQRRHPRSAAGIPPEPVTCQRAIPVPRDRDPVTYARANPLIRAPAAGRPMGAPAAGAPTSNAVSRNPMGVGNPQAHPDREWMLAPPVPGKCYISPLLSRGFVTEAPKKCYRSTIHDFQGPCLPQTGPHFGPVFLFFSRFSGYPWIFIPNGQNGLWQGQSR